MSETMSTSEHQKRSESRSSANHRLNRAGEGLENGFWSGEKKVNLNEEVPPTSNCRNGKDVSSYDAPSSDQEMNNDVSPVEDQEASNHGWHDSEQHVGRFNSRTNNNAKSPHGSDQNKAPVHQVSRQLTEFYTISYLTFFAILGTLARLGLQDITFYPGAPIVFSEIWANFAGTLLFGFLGEDHKLFLEEWGLPTFHLARQKAAQNSEGSKKIDLTAAETKHKSVKKTIPLFIGLATGFCGSFTSFSSFMRDIFLALSNDLPTPLDHPADYSISTSTTSTVPRNGGYSFMALLVVPLITISLCLTALSMGAHLAILCEPYTPSLPFTLTRKYLDPFAVFLAWGSWLGALLLIIFPPSDDWRGRALFAILFAPPGCLLRFYISKWFNTRLPHFPLGTFLVNMLGTAVLGMCWDLQHVPLGGVVSCQVLHGIQDGFCGCLTTVSTWIGELMGMKRGTWKYGASSVVVGTCLLIVIMGSLRWTHGFEDVVCSH